MKTAIRYVLFILTFLLLNPIANNEKTEYTFTVTSQYLNKSYMSNHERILFPGQVGEDVYRLKIALRSLGYSIKNLSYQYDSETAFAVHRFQKDNGLKADKSAGTLTLDLIYKKVASENLASRVPQANIKTAVSNGYWITINKNSNTLTLLKGKQILRKYHIATGKNWTDTPQGKFKIVNKIVNPEWFHIKGGIPENPLGYRWMGLSIENGWIYGIHGNNNPRSIGTYTSNGCIRMYNQDVEYLYSFLNTGTPVWIGSQGQLSKWGVY